MTSVLKTALMMIALVAIAVGARLWVADGGNGTGESAQPAIGGPFALVGDAGETFTDEDFKGSYMLIYFGYTYCPDVCPTSLTVMTQALDQLPETTVEKIAPIFISVDPARDTPEHVSQYVTHFHPDLIGLTGSEEQIKAVTGAYRVYYAKVEEEGADPMAYLMDHSSITYLMGPNGDFLTHFPHDTTPDKMAKKLAELVQ